MITLLEKPRGYIYAEQITPFPLTNTTPLKETETYNEAIDTLIPFHKSSPYEKKIKSMEYMIHEQEDAIKKQEELITENTKKGELIYEKYQPLQKLLEIVKEMRKTKDWSDIALELKKEKKIQRVDLKTKKIIIEL
jgi:predicted ribosome quality control (RQC) complex YloA/Tae2 family protein